MTYFVYILKSEKDLRYYVGYTSDLEKRLAYHNSGKQRHTRHRRPFRLVYYEEFDTKTKALKRERQIKSYKGGAAFKKLIEGV